MKYRIIKADKYNWDIEERKEAGQIISRGPYAGQPMKAGWKPSENHYNTLKSAALGLLDIAAGDALLTGEATTILEAIKVAERTVLATLAVMDMGIQPPPPLSIDPNTLPELSCNEPSK